MSGSQRFTTDFNFPGQQPSEFVTASTHDTVLSTRSASIRLILSHAREKHTWRMMCIRLIAAHGHSGTVLVCYRTTMAARRRDGTDAAQAKTPANVQLRSASQQCERMQRSMLSARETLHCNRMHHRSCDTVGRIRLLRRLA